MVKKRRTKKKRESTKTGRQGLRQDARLRCLPVSRTMRKEHHVPMIQERQSRCFVVALTAALAIMEEVEVDDGRKSDSR